MKHLISLILLVGLLFSLTACDPAVQPETAPASEANEPTGITQPVEATRLALYTDPNQLPAKAICTDGTWYMLLNQHGQMRYQLSVSDDPSVITPVYETPEDCIIACFTATADYAAWCEQLQQGYRYCVYDKATGAVTPFWTIQSEYIQPPEVAIYQDIVYFNFIDYDTCDADVMRYYIKTGEIVEEHGCFYYASYSIQAMNQNDAELIIATPGRFEELRLERLNLEQQGNIQSITLPDDIKFIYAMDYDAAENCYAFEYGVPNTTGSTLAIYRPGDNTVTPLVDFSAETYLYHYKLEANNGTLVWVTENTRAPQVPEGYEMTVYDYLTNTMQTYPRAFSYSIADDGIYYLSFAEEDSVSQVELYHLKQ